MVASVAVVGAGLWWVSRDDGHPFADEIEEARATWAAAGIDDYTLTVDLFCYCFPRAVTVTVVDGEIVEAIDDQGDPVAPHDADDVATVEALLRNAELASRSGDLSTFEVDGHGVPLHIVIDAEPGIDDSGAAYTATFTPA